MKLLGIDNVFFEVGNLDKAIDFYEKLGFQLKLKIQHIQAALFKIGDEEPSLIIKQSSVVKPSKLWVEVFNAMEAQNECIANNINGVMLETATGHTFEIKDDWGNIVGFADYNKKPELARKSDAQRLTKSERA